MGLMLAATLAAACDMLETPGQGGQEARQAVVHIETSIDDDPVATKATFQNEENYGIFACVSGGYTPYKASLYNVRANKRLATSGSNPNVYYYPNGWGYNYIGADGKPETGKNAGSNVFILTERPKDNPSDPDVTADLFAYAPWVEEANASGPTAIPFTTTQQKNWMYAAENGSSNQNLNPVDVSPLFATFTFQHAMARLVFRFKLRHDYDSGSEYLINTVSVARTDESVPLCASGTFNAITGAFENMVMGNSLTLRSSYYADVKTTDTWAAMEVYLVPMEISADDQLTFTFSTGGMPLHPFSLKRAHVQHGSSATYGFKAGYTYVFDFLMDNYLYLDGFSVNTTWTDDVPLGSGENI